MLQKIKSELFSCIQEIYPKIEFSNNEIEVSCLYDEKGDFTSNLCLKYSKLLNEKPSDIAKNIIDKKESDDKKTGDKKPAEKKPAEEKK